MTSGVATERTKYEPTRLNPRRKATIKKDWNCCLNNERYRFFSDELRKSGPSGSLIREFFIADLHEEMAEHLCHQRLLAAATIALDRIVPDAYFRMTGP